MADASPSRASPSRTSGSALRTALWLTAFVLLGFLARSVFVGFANTGSAPAGFDTASDRNLFTGNDPYYDWRLVNHIRDTGSNLDIDHAINYPLGRDNPNPPLWDWLSAGASKVMDAFHVADPAGTGLNVMVALVAALTCIPVYMIARDLWSRRAGLWAAFFMAISAPHIQRTSWGYPRHEAVAILLILMTLAFVVRAFKVADLREQVAHWGKGRAVRQGLSNAIRRNRLTLAYSMLAGVAITATAVAWKGYPYVFGILAVAAFVQLVMDHLRNRDSTVTWMIYFVAMAIGVVLPWLLYYDAFLGQMQTTVIPTLYVLLGLVAIGLVLVPTRDLPSILVFPALVVLGVVGLVGLKVLQPGTYASITTGLGYFQQSKLYSTIAEAQRPELGEVAAALGFFTFLLAFWGLFRTIRMGLRGDGPNILVFSWSLVAIFMMLAASRFEVNAAPAFAVLLGYPLDRLMAMMGGAEVRKRFRAQHGQNAVARSFRSLSWKTVVGVVLVGAFLVFPNLWLGVDASMPQEYKTTNLHNLVDYSTDKNGNFRSAPRLGAFGISFDDIAGSEHWVRAMDALSKRDTCKPPAAPTQVCAPTDPNYQPEESRPAFIGWWDYGHWAVAIGMHPTVADPFQSHYELSGRFLASDSEQEAQTWLTLLLLESDRQTHDGHPSIPVQQLLDSTNQTLNTLGKGYAADYLTLTATKVDPFSFYDKVATATGHKVSYMGVSSRMYPSQQGGIFYAPVFLADKNPDDYVQTQVGAQFPAPLGQKVLTMHQYEMVDNHSVRLDSPKFTDDSGNQYVEYQGYLYPVGQTPLQGYSSATGAPLSSQNEQTQPTTKFFTSLFARAFGGEILPGPKNAQGTDLGAAAGNGLTHWRVVNETSFGTTLQDGTAVQARGVVLLAYYHGVTVNGTLVDDAGQPMANAQVAFQDGHGARHGQATTDSKGAFSVLAPFSSNNDLALVVVSPSGGVLYSDNRSAFQFSEADAQSGAVRTGIQVTVPRGSLTGRVFVDSNGNGTYEASNDTIVAGATVTVGSHTVTTGADGTYTISGLTAGDVSAVAGQWPDYANSTAKTVTVKGGAQTTADLAITLRPGTVHVTFQAQNGTGVASVAVKFHPQSGGSDQTVQTNANGTATASLAPGTWSIVVDQNVTTPGHNGTAPTTVHYTGHASVDVARGGPVLDVKVKDGS